MCIRDSSASDSNGSTAMEVPGRPARINVVYVVESAEYGVAFTSCLCENPSSKVRASEGF